MSEAVESIVTGTPLVVAIAAPVRSRPGGPVVGYMSLGYPLTTIQDVVRTLGDDQNLLLTVTDGRGVILASPNQPTGLPSVAHMEPVRRALAGEQGVISLAAPEGQLFMGFAPVPGIGWAVLAEERSRRRSMPLRHFRRPAAGLRSSWLPHSRSRSRWRPRRGGGESRPNVASARR